MIFKNILRKFRAILYRLSNCFIRYPTYGEDINKKILKTDDPIRYMSMTLAIKRILFNEIQGAFAEIGVYKGETSKLICQIAPEKRFYLFDTFEGFPEQFIEKKDDRFKDTSVESIKKKIGGFSNIIIKKGIFPETTKGIEDETFSFVIIDLDLYEPTFLALEFFYPRITSWGYIFIHDYNNPDESEGAVRKAVDAFSYRIDEEFIEIPDKWGSVIIRKN